MYFIPILNMKDRIFFKSWNRDFRLLAFADCGVGAFFGVHFVLFNNFIVDRIGIEAHELGYMEALREVPGFLNALFIAIMIRFAPPIVGGLSLILMRLVWQPTLKQIASWVS